MNRKPLILIVLIIFCPTAFSASIGTVPGSIDFGEVERGETKERILYITVTDFDESVGLQPNIINSAASKADPSDTVTVSEEDFADWVEFRDLEFNSSTVETVNLPGGSVNANGRITVALTVPEDAEPGHHYGNINLNPSVVTGSGGGTVNWGEITPSVEFEVSGDARRSVSISGVRAFRTGQESASVEVLLENTGTVTTSVRNFNLTVLDSRRNVETHLLVSGTVLDSEGSDSSERVDAGWTTDQQIEEGTYYLERNANYLTGSATATGDFTLPGINRIEVRPDDDSGGQDESERDSVPVWFVVIVLTILGVLMWGFEIEPFWIVAILGVLGISAFILLSGLPNFLLVILLVVVGIAVYGGM